MEMVYLFLLWRIFSITPPPFLYSPVPLLLLLLL